MRKLLLGTTAIAGALAVGGIAGTAIAADPPKVTVGGFTNFQIYQYNQDITAGAGRGYSFLVDDTELRIDVAGVADNGLRYGVKVEMENGADRPGTLSLGDEVVLTLQGDWGRLDLGNEDGADDLMMYGAEVLMAGPGGFDGDFDDVFNTVGIPGQVFGPNMVGDNSDATKITYYTPRIAGFQLGVSFTPDSGQSGGEGPGPGSNLVEPDNDNDTETHIGIGLNYQQTFSGVGVNVSFAYIHADAFGAGNSLTGSEFEDIDTWSTGAFFSYMGFRIGGSYSDAGDGGTSPTKTAATVDNVSWWNVGGDYTMGPWRASVGYHTGTREFRGPGIADDETDIVSGAIQYTVAPGLIAYFEFDWLDFDRNGTASDNDGHVVIFGTQLSF